VSIQVLHGPGQRDGNNFPRSGQGDRFNIPRKSSRIPCEFGQHNCFRHGRTWYVFISFVFSNINYKIFFDGDLKGFGSIGGSCPRASTQKPETKKQDISKEETKPEENNPKTDAKKEVIIPVTLEKDEIHGNVPSVNPYAQLVDAARAVELANAKAITDIANQAATSVQTSVAPKPVEAIHAFHTDEAKTDTSVVMASRAIARARMAAAQAQAPPQHVAEAVAEAAALAPPQDIAEAVAKIAAEANDHTPSQIAAAQAVAQAAEAAYKESIVSQQAVVETTAVKAPHQHNESGDWTIVDHSNGMESPKSPPSPVPVSQFAGARPKELIVEKAPLHPGTPTMFMGEKKML
jgi:hypothetical protein